MALNILNCNHLTPLDLKVLKQLLRNQPGVSALLYKFLLLVSVDRQALFSLTLSKSIYLSIYVCSHNFCCCKPPGNLA